MFCPNCGAPNPDSASQCGSCGTYMNTTAPTPGPMAHAQPGYPAGPVAPVPNHLVVAILTTLFCCLPFGVASIVYASQVNTKLQVGDYEGAWAASKNAKLWSLISFFTVLIQVLMVAAGEM